LDATSPLKVEEVTTTLAVLVDTSSAPLSIPPPLEPALSLEKVELVTLKMPWSSALSMPAPLLPSSPVKEESSTESVAVPPSSP
jgi:hypothetical protein